MKEAPRELPKAADDFIRWAVKQPWDVAWFAMTTAKARIETEHPDRPRRRFENNR